MQPSKWWLIKLITTIGMAVFIIESNLLLLGAILLLGTASLASAGKTRLVDNDGIEAMAHKVCTTTRGTQSQIGNITSIGQLVAFFDNLPAGSKWEKCRDTNIEALHLLYDVVSKRNDNVCSDEKISLIEKFHHKYISRTIRDKRQRKADNAHAAKLLILFFYHYANEVGTICKNNSIEQVKAARTMQLELQVGEDSSELYSVDNFLSTFMKQLRSFSGGFKIYDKISLVWNFIDKLPITSWDKYFSDTGRRCTFNASDVNSAKTLQRECATHFRPLYGMFVLPAIRLIDLGYYLEDEPFAAEYAEHKDLRRLIGVAQVCEFLLPIRIERNSWIPYGDMVLLTKQEASEIPESDTDRLELVDIPDAHCCSSLDQMYALSYTGKPESAQFLVENIKANVRARERVLWSTLRNIVHSIKKKVKSMAGKLFNKHENGEKEKDIAPLIDDHRTPIRHTYGEPGDETRKRGFWERLKDHIERVGDSFKEGGFKAITIAVVGLLFDIIIGLLSEISKTIFRLIAIPTLKLLEFVEDRNEKKALLRKLMKE